MGELFVKVLQVFWRIIEKVADNIDFLMVVCELLESDGGWSGYLKAILHQLSHFRKLSDF